MMQVSLHQKFREEVLAILLFVSLLCFPHYMGDTVVKYNTRLDRTLQVVFQL